VFFGKLSKNRLLGRSRTKHLTINSWVVGNPSLIG